MQSFFCVLLSVILTFLRIMTDLRLPAEWEPQSGILLAWPHENTDWNYMLTDVQQCFREIASAVTYDERLIVVAPDVDKVRSQISDLNQSRISYFEIPTNDTWARDFGAITVLADGQPELLNFKFNAWGMKFAANLDNLINDALSRKNAFKCGIRNHKNFVLEGGSVESDGQGCVLTTEDCLLSPNRNGGFGKKEIEQYLKSAFGAEKILWLKNGALEGDDTDSHIDTLARFAPGNIILYSACTNASDSHYIPLHNMEEELKSFSNAHGERFKLVALPIPAPIFDEDGFRLPATYANFLITNSQVLVPTYGQPDCDEYALRAIQGAFPDRKIQGIDCTPLIRQHGSLHCVTMQFPQNVLK